MYLLGYDIGSSTIKAALVHAGTGQVAAAVQSPDSEMSIAAPQPDWAEQDPETWWEQVCLATRKLLAESQIPPKDIKGIGISYQMHGLVVVDKALRPLRPAIIWCDSRAVAIGERAFDEIGPEKCLASLLNSPGNFTASKLGWVKENEPAIYQQIHRFLLPGDYIAMRLTGEAMTTPSGLSEGVFWDFTQNSVSESVLGHFGFEKDLVADITPTFSLQGQVTMAAAAQTGLQTGTPVAYRAGDQPNNAGSLNVLRPGDVAATGGTSGVVYGVVGKPVFDPQSRVNGFAHVNHTRNDPRIGLLLCINGSGILYSWMRQNMVQNGGSYREMDGLAAAVPVGSDGLCILPFGNGAERMLGNKNPGAQVCNLHFNRHTNAHLYRAALEGIAFSFVHGVQILKKTGVDVTIMRVGNDNLFRSPIFAQTIANLVGCSIELVKTTGAIGAAKSAGVATGFYNNIEEAMSQTEILMTYRPQHANDAYSTSFYNWENALTKKV